MSHATLPVLFRELDGGSRDLALLLRFGFAEMPAMLWSDAERIQSPFTTISRPKAFEVSENTPVPRRRFANLFVFWGLLGLRPTSGDRLLGFDVDAMQQTGCTQGFIQGHAPKRRSAGRPGSHRNLRMSCRRCPSMD